MNDRELDQRLSQIATQWTMLYQAHKGQAEEAAVARQILMQRYCGAVFRYLLRAVRDVCYCKLSNNAHSTLNHFPNAASTIFLRSL